MHRSAIVAVAVVLSVPVPCLAQRAPAPAEDAVLLKCYLRYQVSEYASGQAAKLGGGLDAARAAEVKAAADEWSGRRMGEVRAALQERFGDSAKGRFEGFIGAFTEAERKGDPAYLAQIAGACGLATVTPATYADLRGALAETWLKDDVASASAFLGNVETWRDLLNQKKDVPPLAAWLARNDPVAPAAPAARRAAPASPPARAKPSLADAEAPAPAYEPPAEAKDSNPLDSFSSMRKERREQALEQAHAGMQQVAAERQAAEEEFAAKKTAAAQAEAEAVKRQAQQMADVEQQALEQRKNSWGAKVKTIVGATISAATGAFTGGLGTRAADAAIGAIFNDSGYSSPPPKSKDTE